MRNRVAFCLSLLAALISFVFSASAQVSFPAAALVDGNVWLFTADGGSARQITAAGSYAVPVWSPNGQILAYTGSPDSTSRTLYALDRAGAGTPVPVASGLNTLFPISFAPDSSRIIYALAASGDSAAQQIDVYGIEPRAGAAPQRLGGFTYQGGCGGSAAVDPSEVRYSAETGSGAAFSQPQMELTAFGLLHSTGCLDHNRLLLLDLGTGEERALPFTARAFVAPDRSYMVFPREDRITIVSDPDSIYTEIAVSGVPDQVGFGANGDIYFSTRVLIGQTTLSPDAAAQLGQVLFIMPRTYAAAVYRFNILNGALQKLYEVDAYGIGRLGGTADGAAALFSVIPNPSVWVSEIEAGRLRVENSPAFFAAAETQIFAVSLSDLSVMQIGTDWERLVVNTAVGDAASFAPPTLTPTVTLTPTQTSTPTATFTPAPTLTPTLPPSGLGAGVVATVSDQLVGLNLRETPGTQARIIEVLLPGAQVTVIEGSIPREGFDWWRIEAASGARGWVAEVVGGVQTIVP